jgi:hypothetical protein
MRLVPCETCGSLRCICADLAKAEPEEPRLLPGERTE